MREMSICELKQALSETLHRVERGEHVRVTSRGHAIADIVPIGPTSGDSRLTALVLEGKLTRATLPRPLVAPWPTDVLRSASQVIRADRADERRAKD
ncbi:MAG: type II toxin-antitoxin system prevent-host-death family antitoxin [Thermoleophilaceae bacterium]|nr:type II toxin-antitoxin system prevent-host-death family antitoxin [Thermoleophilaceae bacterium]